MFLRPTVLTGLALAAVLTTGGVVLAGVVSDSTPNRGPVAEVVTPRTEPATPGKPETDATGKARGGPVRLVGKWGMGTGRGWARNLFGGPAMHFLGGWSPAPGRVGPAVSFHDAPALGLAPRTGSRNPNFDDFAFGAVFTTRPLHGSLYSGNLMQKGYWDSTAQLKLELLSFRGGTVRCHVKGSRDSTFVISSVVVDDGRWHEALCWRSGSRLGLTVDRVTRSVPWNLGSVASAVPVRLGNKNLDSDASDQHFGKVDCAVYILGADARARAAANLPC